MRKIFTFTLLLALLAGLIAGCGSSGEKQEGEQEPGTLKFTANGEDFVRQGFTSKDGWQVKFDHVYVTLAEVTAYQADPPYDPHASTAIQAQTEITLPGTHTVDLAEGDEDAPPVLVGEVKDVPAGHYNAISWKMVKAATGPSRGYSLVIAGQATKAGQTIDFVIQDETEYKYTGGEYIGDERKGIVETGGTGELEMTFHFDHLFGDAGVPLDDELNQGAPGFEPFAALAGDGKVEVDMAELQELLPEADYQKLRAMLVTLGHVGEGHCRCDVL